MRALSEILGEIGIISIIFVFSFMITGCSGLVTFGDRSMTIEDIIKMSKAEADSEVIIRQIEVTHSKFSLETADLIWLKRQGVEDDIIEYMIGTNFTPERFSWEYGYTPYDYSFDNFNSYYYPFTSYPGWSLSDYNPGLFYYDDLHYYSPFWGALRGVPYRRYHSPYTMTRPYNYFPQYTSSNLLELMNMGHRAGSYYYQPEYYRYNIFYPLYGMDYFPGRYYYRWDSYRKRRPDYSRPQESEKPEE